MATTALGLVISTFVRSQLAAIFAASIINVVPAVNFSGFMSPVSALTGPASLFGALFPARYFQSISVGVVTKGLGFVELLPNFLALAAFGVVLVAAASRLLPAQER